MAKYDLRKLQRVELEILEELDRICAQHDISYFLDSGTALGAVRHGGFIPWDDDIDVGMMRDDYNKFLKIALKELDKRYFLQTLDTDPQCPCLFAKIRKNGTIYQENNKAGMKMHMGIWIDIFPFDYISSNINEQKSVITKAKKYKNLFMVKKIPHISTCEGRKNARYYIKALIRKSIHICLQIIPDRYIKRKFQKIIDSGKNQKEYVTCLFYGNPLVWRTDGIVPTGHIIFEGREFSCVRDSDYYLRTQYGDYMQLPPEEKRVGHRPLFVDYGED